jgi:hypothetical protein
MQKGSDSEANQSDESTVTSRYALLRKNVLDERAEIICWAALAWFKAANNDEKSDFGV